MSSIGKLLMVSLLLVGLLASLAPTLALKVNCERKFPCDPGSRVCAFNSRAKAYRYFMSEGCFKQERCRHSYWKKCRGWKPGDDCNRENCHKN